MAPETNTSSAASSPLLPLLGNSRSRRGSLASISSKRGVRKDVLAQALDDIHTTASRSDGLTSFHDYDGEGSRRGAKELVSNGVSGLYHRLRQTVGSSGGGGAGASGGPTGSVGSLSRHGSSAGKGRAQSIDSRESLDTASLKTSMSASTHAASPTASRSSAQILNHIKKPPIASDVQSPATLSVTPSPAPRSLSSNDSGERRGSTPKLHTADGEPIPSQVGKEAVDHLVPDIKPPEPRQQAKLLRSAPDVPTQADLDKARSAWVDNDHSELATTALAKVLSHHEVSITDQPQHINAPRLGDEMEDAIDDSDFADGPEDDNPLGMQTSSEHVRNNGQTRMSGSRTLQRPPMVRVGPSHLPGFEPSRASSTMDGGSDDVSLTSLRPLPARRAQPVLEPAVNLNTSLGRKRSGLKPPPASASVSLSTHMKRRVLSKEFWMKDDNAKVCFSCGQSFSTFRRKHHCRTCGQIFDAKCTSLVAGRPFGQPGTVRLCKPCESIIFGSDDDSTVFSDEDRDDYNRSPLPQNLAVNDEEIKARFEGPAFSRTDTEVTTPSIGIPVSRRNREAKRRSAVIEFDSHPHPSLARPSSSHSLVSLSRRPRSSSHRRRQSRHQLARIMRSSMDVERGPFHQGVNDPDRRRLPTFHNDNIIDPDLAAFLSDDGSEEDYQPSIMATVEAHTTSPGEREKLGLGSLLTSAIRKGRSRGTDRRTLPSSVQGVRGDDPRQLRRDHDPSMRPSPKDSRSSLLLTAADSIPTDQRPQSPLATAKPIHAKFICSSALHNRRRDDLELYPASYEHVKKLLAQLLSDHKVPHAQAWQKALLPVLMQCTDDVEPDVQQGDDMDIRHYIKLKKIPGGRPIDTAYVSGIVFSKNVALKTMARAISYPRILIVGFAIEYSRHEAHFMSLEPVIAQEQEYLENLVGRIAALRPTLLLVQKHVSGLALHLLEKAGITVAYNIKESVLAAVARVTQTLMIRSIDKLGIDPALLGRCESFDVKTYVHDGYRKTYIFLSGCEPDLGCTVVLRGSDTNVLRSVKRIAEFMCYVAYNLKLENYLMRDEFVSIPHTVQNQIEAHDNVRNGIILAEGEQQTIDGRLAQELQNERPDLHFKYEQLGQRIRQRILSASPFVVFMQPYILTQLCDLERKLATYKILRDQYAAADEEGDEATGAQNELAIIENFSLVEPDMVNAPASKDQPKAVREYLHAVHEAQLEKAEHTFKTQERQWESFVKGDINPFDPYSHQEIILLYSTVSSITSAPCTGPELLGIGFYASFNNVGPNHDEDITLGQYIEDLCLSANTVCRSCNKKMCDHHRQYVHGYGQLTVSIQRQAAKMRGYANTILMWSTCRICRQETTVTQMSDHTWKYSFAKYLELSFWSSHLHPRAGMCKHDIHRDFLRCFGYQDMVVRMQYDSIDIYDVVVPRARVTWRVEADLTVKNEQYTLFEQRLRAFTDSVRKRLDSINVDTLEDRMAEEAHALVDELHDKLDRDHQELTEKLQLKYATSRYYELIPLNRALRFMDEKAIAWDEEFSRFEDRYFPSEADIRKIAVAQLKNMFIESQPARGGVTSDSGSDTEEGIEKKPVVPKPAGGDDLLNEKAQDVLLSGMVEERKAVATGDNEALRPINGIDAQALLSSEASLTTPRRDVEEAVEREDVKHLDLAVPSQSPPPALLGDRLDEVSPRSSKHFSEDEVPPGESFAIQPKPLSSGLLERIEQIRSNRVTSGSETETPESKIPRLADLQQKAREDSPGPSSRPLFLRAKSHSGHPGHAHRLSADSHIDTNLDTVASSPLAATNNAPSPEKRLSERLGVARLAHKLGKAAPSLIPRSIPKDDGSNVPTTVSALAKHFEQMSREFEKERLKERRQRAMRSRQARANPLASSRPVVEVYQNATDAVGEKITPVVEKDVQKDKLARQQMDEIVSESQPEDLPLSDEQPGPSQREELTYDPETGAAPSVSFETDAEADDSDGEQASTRPSHTSNPASLQSPVASSHDLADLAPDLAIPEHRKSVWFKYLAEFWSKRSASGWANLDYPLHANEHVFEDSDIIVREDEPSSVIALALACTDYRVKEKEFRNAPSRAPHGRQGHAHTASQASAAMPKGGEDGKRDEIKASLLSELGTHMKYSFNHGPVKASCKIFYAESFDALRRRCGVAERFMESMSRCLKFDSKGGKTKSLFLRTLDNRFIIKSLQEVELKAFNRFAPDYFNFMSYTLFHGVPSVIAKMFGLFQVNIRNPGTGVDFSYYLLVMENLFYESNPNRRFDLKGSMRNRKIESTGQADEVLLDENLVETIFESPLFVREHARKLLQASVFNDTLWLCKQNVMDYSLMAGFDDTRKELVVGIIDCIRTYTWDKKLESWIKDRGKNKPTITSPKDYRNRFRVSMMQYVLQAPNCWHQFQAQMMAPKTLIEQERDDGAAVGTVEETEMEGKL